MKIDKFTKKVIKIGVLTLASCYLISITFRTISSFILYTTQNTKSIITLKEDVNILNKTNSILLSEVNKLNNKVYDLEVYIEELKNK